MLVVCAEKFLSLSNNMSLYEALLKPPIQSSL
jgi:hypothetical protein